MANRIVMFSDDDATVASVKRSLRRTPSLRVDAHRELLSSVNGSAVGMAKDVDLIIFKAGDTPEAELTALVDFKKKVGDKRAIIALADESLSLAEARRFRDAGVSEILPDNAPSAELAERIEYWARGQEYQVPALRAPDPRLGRVIGVTQARGGLGATTLGVNLAARLLDPKGLIKKTRQHKVVLVDLDIQYGGVASHLDIEPTDALYQMITDGTVPDANYIEQALVEHPSGLRVLTAPKTLCPIEALGRSQAAALIDTLRDAYDFVIVDLPRVLCDWMPAVIDRTDRLLLMTDTTVPTIRQARRLIDILTEDALNLDVQMVVSREVRPMLPKRHHKVAQQILERDFGHWLPDDAKACRSASDRGVPISRVRSRSPLSRAIDNIARQLIKDVKAQQAAATVAQG